MVGYCKCYDNEWDVCDNITETSTLTSNTTQNIYKISVFLCELFYMVTLVFYTVMPACFKITIWK